MLNKIRSYLIPKGPYSIKQTLSKWVAIAMIIVAIFSAIVAFLQAYHEITDFQDETLVNIAKLVQQGYSADQALQFNQHELGEDRSPRLNKLHKKHFDGHVPDAEIMIDYIPHSEVNQLHNNLAIGFDTYRFDDQEWRTYKIKNSDQSFYVIKQPTDIRYEIAFNNALASLYPIFILLLLLLLAIQYIIRLLLEPVDQLSQELESRQDNELSPLKYQQIPSEITPFVTATNHMMGKVSLAIEKQQRFIADAAHELRSPLTAISLQVQHMQKLDQKDQQDTLQLELEKLSDRVKRNQDLVEQLLSLSKAQHIDVQQTPVAFKTVLKLIIADLLPIADDKNIDFDVTGDDLTLLIDQSVLVSMLKNVIQNALQYSPSNTTVNIDSRLHKTDNKTCARTYAIVTISDEGEGIEPKDYDDVFQPFTSLTSNETVGSGLGLSIVKQLCDQLGVEIRLDKNRNNKVQSGLQVSFEFPQNLLGD